MRREALVCLLLIVTTLAVFGQVRNFDFVEYDDPDYVANNRHVKMGLTRDSVIWAFTTSHTGYWHPLTWLSLVLDFELYGLKAGGYHATNLLFHLLNTLLLFLVLKRSTGGLWRSGFVAALFALHPLRVESVAWIAERKDVLSTFFWMLTMWAYVRYAERRSPYRYLLGLLCFALGLMAKPMVVTLPFVLLLLDYWPLDRFKREKLDGAGSQQIASPIDSNRRRLSATLLLWEKVPFFILAAACSVVTFLGGQSEGAVESLDWLPINVRLANALVSYIRYIGKMIWPQHLTVLYLHPGHTLPLWQVAMASVLLTALTIVVIWGARHRHRYLVTGWLWYLGTLVPVIGLVQVGLQAMADRYTYVPLIGIFIIIAWGIPYLFKKIRHRRVVIATAAGVVLFCLMTRTWLQLGHWKNSIMLFKHGVAVTANNYVMHNSLGLALAQEGTVEEAILHYSIALRIKPEYIPAHNNLGVVLADRGRLEEAIAHYSEALRLKPNYVLAHNNLGNALAKQGRLEEAIAHFSEALRIKPDDELTHNSLGHALAKQGRLEEATTHLTKAMSIKPEYAEAHNNLGVVLAEQGKLEKAMAHYSEALRVKPDYVEAHNNLGHALSKQGRREEAIAHYSEALRLKPEYAEAHNNMGVVLAEQGKLEKAMAHYSEALRVKPDYVEAHNNLGVVLDIQGRLEEAIFHFSEALRIDPKYVKAYNNFGVALAARGRLEEATPYFFEALRIRPDYAEAHNNLGLALAREGMFEKAIYHYDKALSLNPEYAEAHNNLGVALAAQGRFREAIAHFSEALRIRPDYVEAQRNLQLFLPLTGKASGESRAIGVTSSYII
jgi:tetratricopeptide (TPR) repeat protein